MSDAPRPLTELRAEIDALDQQLLELLRRRTDVVAEVAAYKRHHSVRIRDFARERTVLEARRAIADSLGLNGGVVESIYRLIMLASRDYQASLKVEVPAGSWHTRPATSPQLVPEHFRRPAFSPRHNTSLAPSRPPPDAPHAPRLTRALRVACLHVVVALRPTRCAPGWRRYGDRGSSLTANRQPPRFRYAHVPPCAHTASHRQPAGDS